MREFFKALLMGMGSVLALPASALYRYPYRNSAEGLHGDMGKIGKDIESAWGDEHG